MLADVVAAVAKGSGWCGSPCVSNQGHSRQVGSREYEEVCKWDLTEFQEKRDVAFKRRYSRVS